MKFLALFALFTFLILISSAQAAVTGISYQNVQVGTDNQFGSASGKMWIINWNGRDTDQISGTLTSSELKAASGTASKQDFSISMTSGDEYAEYSFYSRPELNDIYTIKFVSFQGWTDDTTAWTNIHCMVIPNSATNVITQSIWFGAGRNVWCAEKNTKLGSPAGISTPRDYFSTSWTLQASGKNADVQTITNANSGQTSVKFGNDAIIKWQGNLGTGYHAPVADTLYGIHSNTFSNGWIIGDYDRYNQYANYISNNMIGDLQAWANNCQAFSTTCDSTRVSYETNINIKASNAITSTSNQQFQGVSVTDTSSGTSLSGRIKYNLAESVSVPNFQLLINADYLQLVIPTGKPQITSVSSVKFTETTTGTVSATFKNIGNGAGSFDVKVDSCSSGFSSVSGTINFNMDAGASRSQNFVISGSSESTTSTITGTCTVRIRETTTQEEAAQQVQVSFDQKPECEVGKQIPIQNADGTWKICTCDPNGLTQTCSNCPSGQIPKPTLSGYVCEEKTCPFGTNLCVDDVCRADCGGDGVCPAGTVPCADGYCRATCEAPPVTDVDMTVVVLVLLVVLSGLVFYAMNGRDIVWLGIGLVVGTIAALVIWLIIQFVLKNWLLIVLGGVVGVAGLWVFYAIGGVAIIAGALAFIKKK